MQIGLILERGQSSRLRQTTQAKMIAHSLKSFDRLGMADRIAHTQPRQSIGFGKGAQSDDALIHRVNLGNRLFVSHFAVSFIQDQKSALG